MRLDNLYLRLVTGISSHSDHWLFGGVILLFDPRYYWVLRYCLFALLFSYFYRLENNQGRR